MPYLFPPLLATTSFNTNAAPNTNTTTNILAAGGANTRYRIMGIHIAGLPANTGKIRAQWQTTAPTTFAHMGFVPGASDDLFWQEPGLQLDDNVGIDIQHSSDVATQGLRIAIYYYLDTVN